MPTPSHTPGPAQEASTAKNTYKGWRIYFPSSGSNNGLRSAKAKHPLGIVRLEVVIPDDGNKQWAVRKLKEEIDKQPSVTA